MAKRILKSKDGWTTVVRRHRRRRQDSNPSKRWTPRGRRASPLSASFRRFHRKDSNEAKWRPVKPKYLPSILSLLPIPVPQAINSLPERRRTCQKLIGTKPSTLQKSKSHFTCLIPFPPPIDSKLKVMTGINTNPQPTGTNPNSYAQVAARPPPPPRNFHHQQPPQRFPPWQYYLDLNPWNCTTISSQEGPAALRLESPQPLPLPSDPNHYKWKGRCYNCLEIGHDQNDCTSTDRVCAKCWKKGHQAHTCTTTILAQKQSFDPLRPRGNMGEASLPPNLSHCTHVFVPEITQMQHDAFELNRAIIVDVRLVQNHTPHLVQVVLMETCKSDYAFQLTHIQGPQYMLLPPHGVDRHRFQLTHRSALQKQGYIIYPWTQAINGKPLKLKYKVWLQLIGMPPQAWTLTHLLHAVGSIGPCLITHRWQVSYLSKR